MLARPSRPILKLRPPEPLSHTITIEVEPFGYGYDVRVLPAPMGVGHDREFRTLPDAEAYAAQLTKAISRSLVFLVGTEDAQG